MKKRRVVSVSDDGEGSRRVEEYNGKARRGSRDCVRCLYLILLPAPKTREENDDQPPRLPFQNSLLFLLTHLQRVVLLSSPFRPPRTQLQRSRFSSSLPEEHLPLSQLPSHRSIHARERTRPTHPIQRRWRTSNHLPEPSEKASTSREESSQERRRCSCTERGSEVEEKKREREAEVGEVVKRRRRVGVEKERT